MRTAFRAHRRHIASTRPPGPSRARGGTPQPVRRRGAAIVRLVVPPAGPEPARRQRDGSARVPRACAFRVRGGAVRPRAGRGRHHLGGAPFGQQAEALVSVTMIVERPALPPRDSRRRARAVARSPTGEHWLTLRCSPHSTRRRRRRDARGRVAAPTATRSCRAPLDRSGSAPARRSSCDDEALELRRPGRGERAG